MQNSIKPIYSLCHLCKSHFICQIPPICNNTTHQILPIPKKEYGKYKHNMLQANLFPLFAVSARVSSTETGMHTKAHTT